jgi:hypothetical protein
MLIFTLIGFAIVALAHTAPVPFLPDAMVGDRGFWHMPSGLPSASYLTYDDGPNPTTTPNLEDWYATRLALSSDGNSLLTGAPMEDGVARGLNRRQDDNFAVDSGAATGVNGDQYDNDARQSGAAYVFVE